MWWYAPANGVTGAIASANLFAAAPINGTAVNATIMSRNNTNATYNATSSAFDGKIYVDSQEEPVAEFK
jgi:hypothetical protein